MNLPEDLAARDRAERTRGISHARIYESILRKLHAAKLEPGAAVVDVGAGRGHLAAAMRAAGFTGSYTAVDLVRHPEFPAELPLVLHDLQRPGVPLPDGSADLVLACEVVPHLENPRVLVRECARLARPGGGRVLLTAPNPVSLRSLLLLAARGYASGFGPGDYPMMLNPVLPLDLRRMAAECGLADVRTFHTGWGRAVGWPGGGEYPAWLANRFPGLCSDNFGVLARRP